MKRPRSKQASHTHHHQSSAILGNWSITIIMRLPTAWCRLIETQAVALALHSSRAVFFAHLHTLPAGLNTNAPGQNQERENYIFTVKDYCAQVQCHFEYFERESHFKSETDNVHCRQQGRRQANQSVPNLNYSQSVSDDHNLQSLLLISTQISSKVSKLTLPIKLCKWH